MTKRRSQRMPESERQLAEKAIELLQQLKLAVRDPDFPQDKIDAIEPVLRRAHANFTRDL